jgi:CubicO group peptidase (beta-lactamase class C family)
MSAIHRVLSAHVERGELPGLVYLVSRAGTVDAGAIGTKTIDPHAPEPMRRDTIFRITSMTKPITAVAAMILVDEGTLRLDDPVDTHLPELALAHRRVLRRVDGPLDDTVPAERSITLRDLLTFRMGFGMLWSPPGTTPIQRAANELHVGSMGAPEPQGSPPPDEWMRRFATLPLMFQPGDRWLYNTGADVLGVLIARAAQMPLERFFEERIFAPLGMKDTGFVVPAPSLDRFTPAFWAKNPFEPDNGQLTLKDPVLGSAWGKPPPFPSGAAGLVSTADDFFAFSRMMMGGGTLDGRRILSTSSIDLMTSDQLTAEQKARSDVQPPGYWKNHGWGFGVAVTTGARDPHGPGGFGWDGGYGTYWCVDPEEQLIAILMTQRAAFPPMASIYRDFFATVYDTK